MRVIRSATVPRGSVVAHAVSRCKCGADAELVKLRREKRGSMLIRRTLRPDSHFKITYRVECPSCGAHSGAEMKTKAGAARAWERKGGNQ